MFTLSNKVTERDRKKTAEALKKIKQYKEEYMQGDNWDSLTKEEKVFRVEKLLKLTQEITQDQSDYMKSVTSGRAGDDFFDGPMEWVRKVDVCKSERLKFDIKIIIPMLIKLILVGAGFYIGADLGITNPLIIPIVIGIAFLLSYTLRDLVRISKAAWIMGYIIGCVDTGAPLVRMFVHAEARDLADQLMQVSLKAVSASQLKRYIVMVNANKIPKEKLPELGVKDAEELYGKLMVDEPHQAIVK